jgi:hypothetical protein
MLKKFSVVLTVCAAILVLASKSAQASLVMYDTRTAWEAAVGTAQDLSIGSILGNIPASTPIGPDVDHTMTFSVDLSRRQVGTSGLTGWSTWSGGLTPVVIYTNGLSSLTGTFSGGGPRAFGLEMEPNNFGVYNMNFLVDGVTLTQGVNGDHGARFFGYVADHSIPTMTLSADPNAEGFAFGRVVYADVGNVVPEPATMILFSLGGAGMLLRRRSRKA